MRPPALETLRAAGGAARLPCVGEVDVADFGQEPFQPLVVERAFGGGAYAVLTTFGGGLWIDNLVLRQPSQGFGGAALRAICAAADAEGSEVSGAVELNGADGKVKGGLGEAALLRWYRAEAFERLPVVGAIVVRRRPRA